MAFDYLGTFNVSGLERFKAFSRAQVKDIDQRIAHLNAELNRVGVLQFSFDSDGAPKGYSVARPPDSYISKLVAAYEALGGDPFYDLRIRSQNQPVYVVRGDEAEMPTRMSSGEIISMPGQADGPTAELMRQARSWLDETLRYRREHLERKIRRAVDYSDQLQAEIVQLQAMKLADTAADSLENIFKNIGDFVKDRTFRAVYDDKGKDPFGLKANAPFRSYETGPEQTEGPPGRGLDGYEDDTREE